MGRKLNSLRGKYNRDGTIIATALASLVTAALALSGCEISSSEKTAIDVAFQNQNHTPTPVPTVAPSCHADRFEQPPAVVTRKLDLLFLTDTSSSLVEERGGIAAGIDAFIQALPANVDYRIAVMLAHGSHSSYSGRVYRYSTAPYVLDSQLLTTAQIRTYLQSNLVHTANDAFSDGGEEGMYSLTRALTTELAFNQTKGFFRNGAALAVVFVADENDICAVYPQDVQPVVDSNNSEIPAQAADCGGITPASVVGLLQARQQSRPLVVSGIVYNRHETVPSGGENEYGYGYMETIAAANGLSIDLADGHFQDGLSQIATLAMSRFDVRTEFALSATTSVQASTLQVTVDGSPVPFGFDANLRQIQLQAAYAGGPQSVIDAVYCEVPVVTSTGISDLCRAGEFAAKPRIRVGIVTDPSEGTLSTIQAGLQALGYTPFVYDSASLASDAWLADGTTVLLISRKLALQGSDTATTESIKRFISQGGSIIAEYDSAAWMFDRFEGAQAILQNMNPALELFSGKIEGGGALLPIGQSKTYVTDASHPTMEGLPQEISNGLRAAFALTDYNAEWLHPTATFVSTGFAGFVPAGTYPAMLAGRCGTGRVVMTTMSHLQTMDQTPIRTWVQNSLKWVTGRVQP